MRFTAVVDHRDKDESARWIANQGAARPTPNLLAGGLQVNRSELVLVVEDHAINQQLALLLLSEMGLSGHVADGGREAVELFKQGRYDLILMDVQMPDFDGYQTTSAIREWESQTGGHIPIIALTAHATTGSREQCLAAGMDDFLTKPIDKYLMRETIEKWIGASALPAGIASEVSGDHVDCEQQAGCFIDVDVLTELVGASGVPKLVQVFIDMAPKEVSLVEAAIYARDGAILVLRAHTLKGAFGTLRIESLRQLAAQIEELGKTEDWETIAARYHLLKQQFAVVMRQAQTIVNSGDGQ